VRACTCSRPPDDCEDAVAVSVDPRAASAFASGVDAYDRGRPSYPADLVAGVAAELGLSRASRVLDLGAGTGKLARVMAPLAGRVVAIDPSLAMLAELRRQLPDVEAVVGTAEAIPLPDESVEAVFVGEAFHWFRTARACAEIARVLTPGGGLALVWNRARWSEQQHCWLDAFDALVKPHRRAAGEFPAGDGQWKSLLEDTGLFGPLSLAETDYQHRVSADDFVALVASWSWIANLPEQQRAALLTEIRAVVAGHAPLTLRYRTEIYWTRLT
jgi:SAM-dependent methyltransferase